MAKKPGTDKSGADKPGADNSGAGRPAAPEAPAKPYVVLARKYRPADFDDLIGQSAMVQTLSNAFASGRIAQGYMLTGVRGVGKTTTARILARALNYESMDGSPGGPSVDLKTQGRHCAEIMESRHPDVMEMDAASNTGIDNIREIIENARYRPLVARYKVFIIDEVHMLSKGAFNALLKTLEEPPEHVKFIFATTEIRKVPVTVLSRCQRFDLRRVDVPELAAHFARIVEKEGAQASEEALGVIARAAEGSVRDGLSLLDQAIAMGAGNVEASSVRAMLGLADHGRILDLLEQVLSGNAAAALSALTALNRDGAEPGQLIADLASAIHSVSRAKIAGEAEAGEALSPDERRRAGRIAAQTSLAVLARGWQMLVKGLEDIARAPDRQAGAEMVLIRLAYAADLPPPDEVIRRLGGEAVPTRRAAPPADAPPPRSATLNEAPAAPTATALPEVAEPVSEDPALAPFDPDAFAGSDSGEPPDDADDDGEAQPAPAPAMAVVRSFADVVALAGARRDVKLKINLEERVSLVKFDAVAGAIDIYLLPGGPHDLANELREKLNKWTGRRWVVVLSKQKGERTIGDVRREREAAELAELKRHPAVAAVLKEFPNAEIAAVRHLAGIVKDETGTG